MDQVPATDRATLLSEKGHDHVSLAFRDYLSMAGFRHILPAPFHPQTNGKLERYHRTLKRDVNQLPYKIPSNLEVAIVAFISYYNYRRYHQALGNMTSLGYADRQAAGDPSMQEAGAGPDNPTAKALHQYPQGAFETSFQLLLGSRMYHSC